VTRARIAAGALAIGSSSCAMVMNGATGDLGATTTTPGAKVYVDGIETPSGQSIAVFNDRKHVVLVRAEGHEDRVVDVEPKVQAAPIVLDVVLAVPSLLIAPLVDLSLGWWKDVDPIEEPIALDKAGAPTARARPMYFVGGQTVASTPGGAGPPPGGAPPGGPDGGGAGGERPPETPPGGPGMERPPETRPSPGGPGSERPPETPPKPAAPAPAMPPPTPPP
jgi:hypothetical protein